VVSVPTFLTLGGLVIAFVIFAVMASQEVKRAGSGAIRNLKFQLAIATFVWLIGESLTVFNEVFYGGYEEFLEIHTVSMAVFALIILMRLPQLLRRGR